MPMTLLYKPFQCIKGAVQWPHGSVGRIERVYTKSDHKFPYQEKRLKTS